MTENVAVEKSEVPLKQVQIGKHAAAAIRTCIAQINALASAAQSAQEKHQVALMAHQEHLAGIIQDGGFTAEEFASYGLVEEGGVCYLRARETPKPMPVPQQ